MEYTTCYGYELGLTNNEVIRILQGKMPRYLTGGYCMGRNIAYYKGNVKVTDYEGDGTGTLLNSYST